MRISDWSSDVCSSDLATSHLKRLTNSGGALSPSLIGGLRARFPAAKLYAMYGLTEAFRSTYLDPALIDAHPEAMGKAIPRSEEHTSELQSLMRISYAVFCLKKKNIE